MASRPVILGTDDGVDQEVVPNHLPPSPSIVMHPDLDLGTQGEEGVSTIAGTAGNSRKASTEGTFSTMLTTDNSNMPYECTTQPAYR